MSNISRRKFLKGAGVATLAVAAAGVLAGCGNVPGTDVPDVPEVTSVDLRVNFVDDQSGEGVGDSVNGIFETKVLKGTKRYDPKLIPAEKLPEGYVLSSTDEVDIINNGNMNIANVPVHKGASKSTVFLTLMFTTGGVQPRNVEVTVNKVFDLKSNPNEMINYDDVKDSLLEKCKDIEPDTTWVSYLQIVNGGYKATVPLTVALKG